MNLSRAKTITLLLSLVISLYILCHGTKTRAYALSAFSMHILPVLAIFLAAVAILVAARATMLTCITVLVLMAFSGKRRRLLVPQGKKIVADVAGYLVKVVVKERGLFAVLCATTVSLMAVVRAKDYEWGL